MPHSTGKGKMMKISEVFGETEESEVETETEAVVDEQPEEEVEAEEEATVEDDATTTVAEQDEAEEQPKDKPEAVPMSAFLGVKEELKALKEANRKLEEQLNQKPAEPQKSTEDESEELNYLSQAELYQKAKTDAVNEFIHNQYQARVQQQEAAVKEKYSDYDEVIPFAIQQAQVDPNFRQKLLLSETPVEEAYKGAVSFKLLKEFNGDVTALLEAKRKEWGAVETTPKTEEKPAKKPKAPSLATATEDEKNSAPVVKKSTLDDIFADYPL